MIRHSLKLKRRLMLRQRSHAETAGSAPVTMPILMLTGDRTHDDVMTPDERAQAAAMLNELLTAAIGHGFTQAEKLRALLANGDRSPRTIALAHEAMACIPEQEIDAMLKHTVWPVDAGSAPASETTE